MIPSRNQALAATRNWNVRRYGHGTLDSPHYANPMPSARHSLSVVPPQRHLKPCPGSSFWELSSSDNAIAAQSTLVWPSLAQDPILRLGQLTPALISISRHCSFRRSQSTLSTRFVNQSPPLVRSSEAGSSPMTHFCTHQLRTHFPSGLRRARHTRHTDVTHWCLENRSAPDGKTYPTQKRRSLGGTVTAGRRPVRRVFAGQASGRRHTSGLDRSLSTPQVDHHCKCGPHLCVR